MTAKQRSKVILKPLKIWAALMALLVLTLGYAYLPHAPLKAEASIAIAVSKAALIAIFFMQLREAAWLVRLAAMTGVIWLSFLFMIAFGDYLTR